MTYVDGYVLAVPRDKKEAYAIQAEVFASFAKRHGALSIMESWQDEVSEGKLSDFFRAVQCKADEAVVFAWTIWPSKKVRDAGIKAMQEEPAFADQMKDLPFDVSRMIFGGFETFIEH